VLDNCEHLVAAAARLADRVLAVCPQVRILATSRESLSITGEAGLFLSPKTVEFHLRQIYRKFDVHSRTQLVAVLAEQDTAS
jgi:predicted ATPase